MKLVHVLIILIALIFALFLYWKFNVLTSPIGESNSLYISKCQELGCTRDVVWSGLCSSEDSLCHAPQSNDQHLYCDSSKRDVILWKSCK